MTNPLQMGFAVRRGFEAGVPYLIDVQAPFDSHLTYQARIEGSEA